MDKEEFTSGFIVEGFPEEAQGFTGLEEVYVSASGYARLFRCRRYSRLHILKADIMFLYGMRRGMHRHGRLN